MQNLPEDQILDQQLSRLERHLAHHGEDCGLASSDFDWESEAPYDPEVDGPLPEPVPFVIRADGRIETFDSRQAAEERFDELGSMGLKPDWVAYRQADEDDADYVPDLPTLTEDPPYAEDRRWAGCFGPTDDESVDFLEEDIMDRDPQDLAGWLEEIAREFAMCKGERPQWLAGELRNAAKLARFLGATTPAEFEARRDANEAWLVEGGKR